MNGATAGPLRVEFNGGPLHGEIVTTAELIAPDAAYGKWRHIVNYEWTTAHWLHEDGGEVRRWTFRRRPGPSACAPLPAVGQVYRDRDRDLRFPGGRHVLIAEIASDGRPRRARCRVLDRTVGDDEYVHLKIDETGQLGHRWELVTAAKEDEA